MTAKRLRLPLPHAVAGLLVVGALVAFPAHATGVGKDWDRGCSDAKGGSYDRSSHSEAYEAGWNACKEQQQKASSEHHGKEWQRGCSDAKGGSYDRSKHSEAYEQGWQECKKN